MCSTQGIACACSGLLGALASLRSSLRDRGSDLVIRTGGLGRDARRAGAAAAQGHQHHCRGGGGAQARTLLVLML